MLLVMTECGCSDVTLGWTLKSSYCYCHQLSYLCLPHLYYLSCFLPSPVALSVFNIYANDPFSRNFEGVRVWLFGMDLVKQLGDGRCMCSLLPCALVFVKLFLFCFFYTCSFLFLYFFVFLYFSLIWYE